MKILHNSRNCICRIPFGSVQPNTDIILSILSDKNVKNINLYYAYDGHEKIVLPQQNICKLSDIDNNKSHSCQEKMHLKQIGQFFGLNEKINDDEIYITSFSLNLSKIGLVWYYFYFLDNDDNIFYYGNNEEQLGGEGSISNHIPPGFQITCYEETKLPEWYKNGVIYQIFPDRFNRGKESTSLCDLNLNSNRLGPKRFFHLDWNDSPFYPKDERGHVTHWGFFGGNFKGISEKLNYLQELGVTTIYLNPIFEATSNHKYDTADYMKIDKGFGGEVGFRELLDNAKKLDINIILDGVFSHTGADSIYFNRYGNYDSLGAYQSKESSYCEWYNFTNFPDEYESWWGVLDLPNVNEENSKFKEYLFGRNGVIPHWIKFGIKGWRLDVADELPSSFIKDLRKSVKDEDEEAIILGEVWEDASNKISYDVRREYFFGKELDSVMNYPFKESLLNFLLHKISAQKLNDITMSLKENYPPSAFYGAMNLIGTHDTERVLTVLGSNNLPNENINFKLTEEEYAIGISRLKLASIVQYSSPGVPSIYYGDEAGVQGMRDPYNRSTYPWGQEDAELLEHFKKLSRLRNSYKLLIDGDYVPYSFSDDIYGFLRVWKHKYSKSESNNYDDIPSETADEIILTVINRRCNFHELSVNICDISTSFTDLSLAVDLLNQKNYNIANSQLKFSVDAMSAAIIYIGKKSIQ